MVGHCSLPEVKLFQVQQKKNEMIDQIRKSTGFHNIYCGISVMDTCNHSEKEKRK